MLKKNKIGDDGKEFLNICKFNFRSSNLFQTSFNDNSNKIFYLYFSKVFQDERTTLILIEKDIFCVYARNIY